MESKKNPKPSNKTQEDVMYEANGLTWRLRLAAGACWLQSISLLWARAQHSAFVSNSVAGNCSVLSGCSLTYGSNVDQYCFSSKRAHYISK